MFLFFMQLKYLRRCFKKFPRRIFDLIFKRSKDSGQFSKKLTNFRFFFFSLQVIYGICITIIYGRGKTRT